MIKPHLFQKLSRTRSRKLTSRRAVSRTAFLIAVSVSLLIALGVLAAIYGYSNFTRDLPSPVQLEILLNPENGIFREPTRIVDRSGTQVLWRFSHPSLPSRDFVRLTLEDGEMSSAVSNPGILSALAASDPDYFSRPNLAWMMLLEENQGSIPYQLVEELLLSGTEDHPQYQLRKKFLALQIAAGYDRVKILEWYLNSRNYGNLVYGIEQAANFYFGKSAADLSLSEGALLAAVSRTPALNPQAAPTAARENQLQLITEMEVRGTISEQEAREARNAELVYQNQSQAAEQGQPGFAVYILEEAGQLIPREQLLQGGYRIVSTLDADLQGQLNCTLDVELDRVQGIQRDLPEDCPAAGLLPRYNLDPIPSDGGLSVDVLVLDPDKGEIRALAGKTPEGEHEGVLEGTPGGSLFTPAVYLNYFTQGFEPASLVWDISPGEETNGGNYHPACQTDCRFVGPVNIRTAMANEYLAPAEHILDLLGEYRVSSTLNQMGISGSISECQDCFLYAKFPDLDLVEAAQSYGVYANQGVLAGRQDPRGESLIRSKSVLAVEDLLGNSWSGGHPDLSRVVLSQPLAFMINDVLSDPLARDDHIWQNLFDIGRPAGVKTGYTTRPELTWMVGYTPQQVTAVRTNLTTDGALPDQISMLISTSVWRAVTQYQANQYPVQEWERPAEIIQLDVCRPSGLLPTEHCPDVVQEIFIQGNEPLRRDDLYQGVEINRETGLLASVFTPAAKIEERVYLHIPAEAEDWAAREGLETPPQAYDLDLAEPDPSAPVILQPENFSRRRGLIEIIGSTPSQGFVSYRLQFGRGFYPEIWQQIGEEVFQSADQDLLAVWDTQSLEDGLYALQLVVLQDQQRLVKSSVVISLDNTPPEFEIAGGLSGGEFSYQPGEDLLLYIESDKPEDIQEVDFFLNNRLVAAREFPPFAVPWKMSVGEFRLRVVVTDRAGNQADREAVFSVVR